MVSLKVKKGRVPFYSFIMKLKDFYSSSYEKARHRFREAATKVGARQEVHAIKVNNIGTNLTIDVAIIGNSDPDWVVVINSGIHGVEGFFGSAIQLAWLHNISTSGFTHQNGNVVLIHSLNPYGFEMIRRADENNVDLNRNYLSPESEYCGAPDEYKLLNGFLNPASPPSTSSDSYLSKLDEYIKRYGLNKLTNVVAGGQYQFPKGIFFGGDGPSQTSIIVKENLENWIGTAKDVVHVDFHSGLGNFAEYMILLRDSIDSPDYEWYSDTFGAELIQPEGNHATMMWD